MAGLDVGVPQQNEWAKQQAAHQGVGFRPLGNGFASCENPEALATICHRLSGSDVRMFFDRWQAALPSPLDDKDRQAWVRGTRSRSASSRSRRPRTFDQAAVGRGWFEQTVPDQLTRGRPDHAAVIFRQRRCAAVGSLTDAVPRSSLTQPPTSSNARIRPRSDGMYAVK